MPLVNLKPVLREAKAKGYAVAAFNPVDYASMKAMVKAAEELNAPVIIQSSAKTIKYYGHKAMIGWMREIADDSPVPVVLHLDHGKDLDMIKKCVEMGWTSVMIDWSDKPFETNLETTRKVVDMATKAGIGVEAEIGEIHGVEDDMVVEAVHYTDPAQAEKFCRELDLAAFAAAIGTAHGYYKGEPDVKFDLMGEINRRTNTPMALHGGTGLERRDHPEVHQARLRENQHLDEPEARVHRQLHRLSQEEQQVRAAERARRAVRGAEAAVQRKDRAVRRHEPRQRATVEGRLTGKHVLP